MTEKRLLLILLMSLALSSLFGQNMNSPYSIYGIGDIETRVYNRTSGMGGTGLATRSNEYYIDNNPASISALPRSFYFVNSAFAGKTVTYSGTPVVQSNQRNRDFWVKGIAVGVKINKFWASSIGFKPFSNVNYDFSGNKSVVGSSNTYAAVYEGHGGLNDFYWINGVSLGKHISLGLKSSIIAGNITQTETINNAAVTSTIQTTQQDYFGSPRFEFGAIYSLAVTKKWDFSLGGKFLNETKLPSQRNITVLENTTTILNENLDVQDRFSLPRTYGVGITLTHNKKTTFAADYIFENWSPLNLQGEGWSLNNSSRFSAGVEFAQHADIRGQLVEKRYFQFGGFLNNSYLTVNNTPINEFGITAGMGGKVTGNLLYTLALEGGKRGTTAQNLIKENFLQFTITLTYRDFLFSKGHKYD
jgi:hypothetical protein